MAVVVITGFSATSLGIARCLADSNIEIIAIGHRRAGHRMPLYFSAIPKSKVVVRDGESIVQALLEFRDTISDDPYLMLTEDRHVLEVSENRDLIEKHFKIQIPPQYLIDRLMDKDKFSCLAREMHLKIPISVQVANREQLANVTEKLPFPFVLKPYLLHSRKINNQEELELFIAKFSDVNWTSVIAQQWIPGGDDQLYFCFTYFDRNSEPIACLTARKIRQWPPQDGTTSLCKTVHNDYIREETIRIFRDLRYVGFGSIEYKYHQEEDCYYIMEPTVGRYNQQVALTKAAEVNIPLIAFQYLSTGTVVDYEQKDGKWWVHELADFASRFDSTQNVRGGFMRHVTSADVHVLFKWNDPIPLLMISALTFFRVAKRAALGLGARKCRSTDP